MKKNLLLTALILLWIIFGSQVKALPVIGGLIGFIEFLTLTFLVGYILYHMGLHIYLWFKVRKEDWHD